jgi:hypothetical protein
MQRQFKLDVIFDLFPLTSDLVVPDVNYSILICECLAISGRVTPVAAAIPLASSIPDYRPVNGGKSLKLHDPKENPKCANAPRTFSSSSSSVESFSLLIRQFWLQCSNRLTIEAFFLRISSSSGSTLDANRWVSSSCGTLQCFALSRCLVHLAPAAAPTNRRRRAAVRVCGDSSSNAVVYPSLCTAHRKPVRSLSHSGGGSGGSSRHRSGSTIGRRSIECDFFIDPSPLLPRRTQRDCWLLARSFRMHQPDCSGSTPTGSSERMGDSAQQSPPFFVEAAASSSSSSPPAAATTAARATAPQPRAVTAAAFIDRGGSEPGRQPHGIGALHACRLRDYK